MTPQQIMSQQQLDAGISKLRSPYPDAAQTLTPTTPPMSLTPWLIGGALLGGALYLLFRD